MWKDNNGNPYKTQSFQDQHLLPKRDASTKLNFQGLASYYTAETEWGRLEDIEK